MRMINKKRGRNRNFSLCNFFLKNRKGFIEISFAWLFGIIAGAVILFLAIFAATRIINIGQSATGAETQNQIAVLLNPLETSFQTGQITSIGLPVETRIYNDCDDKSGIFGKQIISVSQQSLGRWTTPTTGIGFQNKYIFSDNVVEGKGFFLFSKPFSFPFKISDLIYMTSASVNYCFMEPPDNVHEELLRLNEKNILLANNSFKCPAKSLTICFHGENCNISVDNYPQGTVTKDNNVTAFYGDALMYGAIFSDKKTYECQLKRLMKRATQLSSLYIEKGNIISQAGCSSSDLISELSSFSSSANSFGNSSEINNLITTANQMQDKNDATTCKLW